MSTAPGERNLAIADYEIQERLGELLPSQRAFIFAPQRFSCVAGGYGSGKSRAGITKGLILSQMFPGNVGMIARYRGTDLTDSTTPLFFEVCPPSWIRRYNKKDNIVTLRNNSVVMFRHIHDANSGGKSQDSVSTIGPKTRRVGANLGWFFWDQMEEGDIAHWLAMISRLRHPLAGRKFGFGAVNPHGHDWIWRNFFPTFRPWQRDTKGSPTEYFQEIRPASNVLGIAVNSEENRVSLGGFVEDAYFDSLLTAYPEEWRERYIYCSFDDFTGKIYKEFKSGMVQIGASDHYEWHPEIASVHVVEPFDIPTHWELVNAIDVGGSGKWAICPVYVDTNGNLIVAQGWHRKAGSTIDPANWIKANLPWNESRTRHVIDWENRPVMLDFAQLYGIHCQPANKSVLPGILRVGGYMHVNPRRRLPEWYSETQPLASIQRFDKKGSPMIFFMRSDPIVLAEHDTAIWHPEKNSEMYKTNSQRWDSVDAVRYAVAERPEASKIVAIDDPHAWMKNVDPGSYRAVSRMDARIAERMERQKGGFGLREADMDELPTGDARNDTDEYTSTTGEY